MTKPFKDKTALEVVKEAWHEIRHIIKSSNDGTHALVLPRELPKGLHLEKYDGNELIVYMKSARVRWAFVPVLFFLVIFPFITSISGFVALIFGLVIPFIGPLIPIIATIFVTIAMYIITWRLWKIFNPDVKITIQPDLVIVGETSFDRQYAGEFRPAGDHKTANVPVGGGLLDWLAGDTAIGGTRLYLQYGEYGEVLDFTVNKYHATDYILFLNAALAQIGAPEPKAHDPQAGRVVTNL